jgi:hypothetical protein
MELIVLFVLWIKVFNYFTHHLDDRIGFELRRIYLTSRLCGIEHLARQPVKKVKRSELGHKMPPTESILNTISVRTVQPRLMNAPRGFNIQAATAIGMAKMLPLCDGRKTDTKMAAQSR